MMNYYAALYGISIIASLVSGAMVFHRYRNLSGLFFWLFTIFGSCWFALYFLFFSGIADVSVLLLLSRMDFSVGVMATISLCCFVYFFNSRSTKSSLHPIVLATLAYVWAAVLYGMTPLIVRDLTYSARDGVFREVSGSLFWIHVVFYIGAALCIAYFSVIQMRVQTHLNRIRFKHIVFAASILVATGLVLQLVLPIFGIWMFEQQLIVLYVFFTAYTFYVLRRYYFSSIGYGIGRILVFFGSLLLSVGITYLIREGYWILEESVRTGYWWSRDGYSVVDVSLGVVLFQAFHFLWRRFLFSQFSQETLREWIRNLERMISQTTDSPELDSVCARELKKIFKTWFACVKIFSAPGEFPELRRYLEADISDRIFIRDVVFMEEKKTRFDRDRLLWEIPDDAFLILPIVHANESVIGLVCLGTKLFGDFYSVEEIRELRKFSGFLELHLKYIDLYGKIRDLSVNLDKKVDEKTLEYNDLLNRQKEFISIISHEVKSPIANAVFQADSIIDDLEGEHPSMDRIRQDIVFLNKQLQDTGELLSKLFSVQYYDTHDVALFRESVRIGYLLETEYEVYSRMHEHIHFIAEIDPDMGFVSIDRIQFQQIISNILGNAIKFADPDDPTIRFAANIEDDRLHVIIEDNGAGFQDIDLSRLFTRYSRWGGGSIGLGMGLYLCKRIVEMHGGTIDASRSDTLWGARFDIRIPVA